MKRILCCSLLLAAGLTITSCQMNKKNADASTTEVTAVQESNIDPATGNLFRGEASESLQTSMKNYLTALDEKNINVESIMVVQHGKVVAEHWRGEGKPDVPHGLWSVSKSFTSTAIGFAVAEGKLNVTDKVISFFPDELPAEVSDNLKKMEIRHLLTMTCGQDKEVGSVRDTTNKESWVKAFLAGPVVHEPGTYYVYNSLGTYMLSAILQKVTGEKVIDYLKPRLFDPLHINATKWQESPQGINCGGWGLFLKTEDLAKMGLFLLQKGVWNDQQLLPQEWVETASSAVVPSVPAGVRPEEAAEKNLTKENSDWVQGYGYQFWRCRHNCFRADGAFGQYIIVMPEKDAVVAVTANLGDMQEELNMIWDYIWTAL